MVFVAYQLRCVFCGAGKRLAVRLNVPNTKSPKNERVYVSYHRIPRGPRRAIGKGTVETIAVKVKDLELYQNFAGNYQTDVIQHLV